MDLKIDLNSEPDPTSMMDGGTLDHWALDPEAAGDGAVDVTAETQPWQQPEQFWPALNQATAHLPAPLGVLELGALRYNARDMLRRAGGVPIRVASKSLRVRELLDAVLALDGYRGILAFTLAEALWLAADHDDIVLGYPTVDRTALGELIADPEAAARITLMVDDFDQLDLIDALAPPSRRPAVRIAIDVDASWRAPVLGHIGVRRSPLHEVDEAARFARVVAKRAGFELVGLMMYEAQIAGQGDQGSRSDQMIRWVQQQSGAELRERRAAVVAALREVAELEFVNGGGTGSLEQTGSEEAVTELTAGSGLTAGHLFDGYRAFTPAPALSLAFDVVRRPGPGFATTLGGGWIASGQTSGSHQPLPVWPTGLRLLGREGAGEVQTPLGGREARLLEIGERVWLRHAKSGEPAERINDYQVVEGDRLLGSVPTYRGEGKAFL